MKKLAFEKQKNIPLDLTHIQIKSDYDCVLARSHLVHRDSVELLEKVAKTSIQDLSL